MIALSGCGVLSTSGAGPPAVTDLRLVVPAAAVEEGLHPSGLSDDGALSPDRGQLVWYTGHDRVRPGDPGTAVVAGHVSYRGDPDVFASLGTVTVGDEVQLHDESSVTGWVVTDVDVVDKADLRHDPRVWDDQDDVARLVLVTCDDELGFRPDGHRVANLVVVAEPADG